MSNKRAVVIVGAGPGGLTAGMLLAKEGFEVEIFEREDRVGGRNGAMKLGGYTFDIEPTFLMMPGLLRELFESVGRSLDDYLDLRPIDPFYQLRFPDGLSLYPTADQAQMRAQIEAHFPGEWPA